MSQTNSKKQANLSARLLSLGAFFAVLCLVYVVVLGVIQYRGSKLAKEDDGLTVRKHTVAGRRGEIYDRNGTLLVGNRYTYDLLYEYDAMPDTYEGINPALVSLVRALEQTGNGDKRTEDYFVLEGTYPHMTFKRELSDKARTEFDRLWREIGFEEAPDAETLCHYFVDRYRLGSYTDAEKTELIRIWYDMNRTEFSAYTPYVLAENISDSMINWVKEQRVEGATVLEQFERYYPYAGYATHILGNVGKITAETVEGYLSQGYRMDAIVGRGGVEEAFEAELHSQNGVLVQKYDDNGVLVKEYYETPPVSGQDVYLTIDIRLQVAAEDSLRDSVERIETAKSGAVVAQDPNTGAVLVLASYPTYDLTLLKDQSYVDAINGQENNPWLNRALNGLYAPGSTYKVGVALAALEKGNITSSTTYNCEHVFHEPYGNTCLGTHGSIGVIEAIRESCNIFFYSIGERFGLNSFTDYTYRLGLGAETGIELGSAAGHVAQTDAITGAIGQADHTYSPLQLNVYLSTIVNGGKRYGAHLLDSVRRFDDDGSSQVVRIPTQPVETVAFGEDTYALLIEAMKQVVSGSDTLSRYFRKVPVTVGGKTGTAEVDNAPSNALFTGFGPAEDPKITVSCIIEGGDVGSNAAIPVSAVMEAYFNKS